MTTNEDMEFVRELRAEAERLMGAPAAYRLMRDAADWIEAALAATPDHQAEAETHGMLPGSHERGGGAECRCGMPWDYWNSRCLSIPADHQVEAPSEREPFDIAREVFDPAFTPRQNMVRAIEADRAARPAADDAAVERAVSQSWKPSPWLNADQNDENRSRYAADVRRILGLALGVVPEQSPHLNEQEQER